MGFPDFTESKLDSWLVAWLKRQPLPWWKRPFRGLRLWWWQRTQIRRRGCRLKKMEAKTKPRRG